MSFSGMFGPGDGWKEWCIHCGWIPVDEHDEVKHGPSEKFIRMVRARVDLLNDALRRGELK